MRRTKKPARAAIFLLLVPFYSPFYADSLLEGYLANDIDLKTCFLELRKEELNSRETAIENGFSVQLSTGQATFRTADGDTKISFEPSVTAALPQAANLSLGFSSDITIESGGRSVKDTALSLSADILSGAGLKRKVALLEAERSLLEARRALQNRALSAETEFYTELRALFSLAADIISARKDLYDDTISFEEIKAQGYSPSSSKYRSAEMEVLSDRHTAETKLRELVHDCGVFAAKCGADFANGTDPFDFLPSDIPQADPVDAAAFSPAAYTDTESAEWTHYINSLSRRADRDFTLQASAGYTFGNSATDSDSADIGASVSWRGVSAGAKVQIPVGADSISPAYTLSASVSPSQFPLAKIRDGRYSLTSEQELLAIEAAGISYDTDLVDQQTELTDIQWEKESNREMFGMYSTLEEDYAKWLKAGIIHESEYLSARANRDLYRIRLLVNDIDMIIYNNETKLLFCRDDEFSAQTEARAESGGGASRNAPQKP